MPYPFNYLQRSRISARSPTHMEKHMHTLRMALFQPDIAGNTGAILRLGACLGVGVDVIGPAGFDFSDRALRRAGMDYLAMAALTRHTDWPAFEAWRHGEERRVVLFTTRAALPYTGFAFAPDDILLFGRESAGVPDHVHETADARVTIPMPGGGRSLNLAMSAAMAAGEALRQLTEAKGLSPRPAGGGW